MNANLSIINEDPVIMKTKEIGNTTDDSGINSNTSTDVTSNESVNTPAGTQKTPKDIIIPFKALNMVNRKESTLLLNNGSRSNCDISNIDGVDAHKNTIDSDGNTLLLFFLSRKHMIFS